MRPRDPWNLAGFQKAIVVDLQGVGVTVRLRGCRSTAQNRAQNSLEMLIVRTVDIKKILKILIKTSSCSISPDGMDVKIAAGIPITFPTFGNVRPFRLGTPMLYCELVPRC